MELLGTILVIDDNADLREIISHTLKDEGFHVFASEDAKSGINAAIAEKPDLIILDVMLPEMDGFEVCKILKAKRETAEIPVMFLSARDQVDDKIRGLNLGGVDYIAKPFKSEELIARIKTLLRRRSHDIGLNPLSKLPGNKVIEEKLYELIATTSKYAVGYLDIDNFKSYNDKHGFFRGDVVLLFICEILNEAIEKYGTEDDFIGHIGGDDFVFVTAPYKVETICRFVIEEFEKKKNDFYTESDIKTGYVETLNRIGVTSKIPLMTISIAVVTNRRKTLSHPAEIASIATELKLHLKTFSGSNYKIDRRSGTHASDEVLKKKKVMIIEAEPKLLVKFNSILSEKNFSIRFVGNGASALLILESMRFDLILINYHVPLIDGFTLFGQIRKNERFSDIPIYVYSSLSYDEITSESGVEIPQEHYFTINNLDKHIDTIIQKI